MVYTAWELETWDDSKEIDPAPTTTNLSDYGDYMLDSIPKEMVKQPGHYKIFPDTEVIDLIRKCLTEEEFKGFCKGNILKYRLRDKENLDEDFAKSKEYKGYLQDIDSI